MNNLDTIGADWLVDQVQAMDDHITRMTPVAFNEAHRYLPQGVSPRPGFIRYDLFPFLREIIECFDPESPVREVNLMKGVQVGYTTLLESILLYYIVHVKMQAAMFITADNELATGRMENNILPMIHESGFADLIRSSDVGNTRKTGKTKDFLQWDGGGFLIYNGAMNAAKMRQYSVPLMLKDELDGWKRDVGGNGNSDKLTDARLSAYWPTRKILRGSTPLELPSMINDAYKRGDQRKYLILCKSCSYPQELRQETVNKETGLIGGFKWDLDDDTLILESVRYCCQSCGFEHFETDKERLFSAEHGAHWNPTARPKEPGIRSYHLPSFYSPYGFRPWSKCVGDFIESFDPETKRVRNLSKFKEYYNNTLGIPSRVAGAKVSFMSVSSHRRAVYRMGQVPNEYAKKYSSSPILFMTCLVDVHKSNLAVTVFGWTRDSKCYVIEYKRLERANDKEDCTELTHPVWGRLRSIIEEQIYTADDGQQYRVILTFIDAGYANDTVTTFCSEYTAGVFPILGRDRPSKNQTIKEFADFKTQQGTTGYRVLVDHYKDRMALVLRREWSEELGDQPIYHFNAPVDITDRQLKELTVETRKQKEDASTGMVSFFWHRPQGANNELWDLLGYGYASVEILAWSICIQSFELDTVDWPQFWQYAESQQNNDLFGRL